MRVFSNIESITGKINNAVVCVGSFDGVHKGHLELFKQMNQRAAEINGQSVVVTFDPHPRLVLKGENRLLTNLEQKLKLLENAGVQNVLVINFTPEFSSLKYDTFVKKYLLEAIGTKVIFSGDGHFFGKDKQGTTDLLEQFGLEVHNIHRIDNISSTAIRNAIDRNDIRTAEQMLGRKLIEI